jgi:hypothetical protein
MTRDLTTVVVFFKKMCTNGFRNISMKKHKETDFFNTNFESLLCLIYSNGIELNIYIVMRMHRYCFLMPMQFEMRYER